jgi:hypothetical protein
MPSLALAAGKATASVIWPWLIPRLLQELLVLLNLRKEINSLLDQWLDENGNALVARWLIEQRERTVHAADSLPAPDQAVSEPVPSNGHSVSDNLLADRLARPNVSRRRD